MMAMTRPTLATAALAATRPLLAAVAAPLVVALALTAAPLAVRLAVALLATMPMVVAQAAWTLATDPHAS